MGTDPAATAPTPCPQCGVASAPTEIKDASEGDDVVTHCEWCGAEYPVPPAR